LASPFTPPHFTSPSQFSLHFCRNLHWSHWSEPLPSIHGWGHYRLHSYYRNHYHVPSILGWSHSWLTTVATFGATWSHSWSHLEPLFSYCWSHLEPLLEPLLASLHFTSRHLHFTFTSPSLHLHLHLYLTSTRVSVPHPSSFTSPHFTSLHATFTSPSPSLHPDTRMCTASVLASAPLRFRSLSSIFLPFLSFRRCNARCIL